MSSMRWCYPGVATLLTWNSPYQETGLYPQVKILDSSGALVDTIDLTANVTVTYVYQGSWTPTSEDEYTAIYTIYTDSGHTTISESISGMDEFIRVKRIPSREAVVMGGGGGEGITKNEIEKIIDNYYQKIKVELDKKSEFNSETDKVKTDIKIPEVNLSNVESKFDDLRTYLFNYKNEIVKTIKSKDLPVNNIIQEIKNNNAQLRNLYGLVLSSLENKKEQKENKDFNQITQDLKNIIKNNSNQEKMLEALNKEEAKRFSKLLNSIAVLFSNKKYTTKF
jgi:hypothetical protein